MHTRLFVRTDKYHFKRKKFSITTLTNMQLLLQMPYDIGTFCLVGKEEL